MKSPPLLTAFLTICSILSAVTPSGKVTAAPPNIIVILTDDQGYGDISAHGHPILKTPNLDRLYRESVRLEDHMISPTCAPTRSALLTGRHEFKNGVTHTIFERERLRPDAITLAQTLKRGGYTTGIFGKWHLGDEDDRLPGKRGFDEVFIHGAGGIGQSYPGSCGDAPGNTYFNPAIWHNDHFEKTKGYCTDVFFGQATKWINKVSREKKPFLAWIATNAPHAPLQVRPEDEVRYKGKCSPEEAKFYGMIANIDDRVGDLLAYLEKHGLERETLIVFMNDNGGTVGTKTFNAGMRGSKGTVWRGGTRGACFLRWPATLKPQGINAPTAHIDFFPTIADLVGVSLTGAEKNQIEGRSIKPLLDNPDHAWPDRYLFSHLGRWPKGGAAKAKYTTCAVRFGSYTLIQPKPMAAGDGKQAWQLYDLSKDPGQKTDISANHADLVKQMEMAYDRWWDSVTPDLVNEDVVPIAENPFKTRFIKQFGHP